MKPTVADVMEIMESIAPGDLAEEWDNSGIQIGRRSWPAAKTLVALDPAPAVVAEACARNADLLITHHPLIFRPLKAIDMDTPIGATIQTAIAHRLAVYSAHTNFDAVRAGLNDILAEKLGLKNATVLPTKTAAPPHGIGRVGDLPHPAPLEVVAAEVRGLMGGQAVVKYAGNPSGTLRRAAICTGSGGGLMDAFLASGADVFISGDFRYHDARTAEWAGVALIDIGHFASEHLMVAGLAKRLQDILTSRDFDARVIACDLEIEPFVVV